LAFVGVAAAAAASARAAFVAAAAVAAADDAIGAGELVEERRLAMRAGWRTGEKEAAAAAAALRAGGAGLGVRVRPDQDEVAVGAGDTAPLRCCGEGEGARGDLAMLTCAVGAGERARVTICSDEDEEGVGDEDSAAARLVTRCTTGDLSGSNPLKSGTAGTRRRGGGGWLADDDDDAFPTRALFIACIGGGLAPSVRGMWLSFVRLPLGSCTGQGRRAGLG